MSEALKRFQVWDRLRAIAGLTDPTTPFVASQTVFPVIVINDTGEPVATDVSKTSVAPVKLTSAQTRIVPTRFSKSTTAEATVRTTTTGKTAIYTAILCVTTGGNNQLSFRPATASATIVTVELPADTSFMLHNNGLSVFEVASGANLTLELAVATEVQVVPFGYEE